LNLIVLMIDTLRQDHVSHYHGGKPAFDGIAACRTPNIDKFAAESVVFDNMYPEALPTIPARAGLMTGARTLVSRPWQPLTDTDISISEILGPNGYVCGIVSDTYHYRAPNMNYHRAFHYHEWVRGQEYDPWRSHPPARDLDNYVNSHYNDAWRAQVAQFLTNTAGFKTADDWFAPQVAEHTVRWLEDNRGHEKVFFWMDSFDPHEPWDPPEEFDTYTDPAYTGPRLVLPMGGMAADWASPEEIQHLRGLYAGEVASVDAALERVFETLREQGYYDDSIVVLMGDHGMPLGEHGKFLKGVDRLYNEILKVPFMVRLPGGEHGGRRVKAMAQFHDFLPTMLDLLGLGANALDLPGRSFQGVIEGGEEEHREVMITGYRDGLDRVIRDHEWSLIVRPPGERHELYNLLRDPTESDNVARENPEQVDEMIRRFGSIYYGAAWPGAESAAMPMFVRRAIGDHALQNSGKNVLGVQGRYEISSGMVD